MVKLLIGRKGSGKTKQMIDLANQSLEKRDGSIVFINKDNRLMLDLKYRIRVVCMEEYPHITNIDEYIGFIWCDQLRPRYSGYLHRQHLKAC